ncbi:transcription factor GTE7-like [Pyrus ussuriensis x Pyrus communis]|uniref:Transcription factor GTE7-like n=1 Tax=Pyrus ussuriensis x Pyrus communis TaxID=2448454 RepID=A0A5N5FNB2_9ROSA|nr:transcription factor GTE7-like [Pyrus ussuriensis x Pyrus communis]
MARSKQPLTITYGKESNSNSKRSYLENGDLMTNCRQVLSKLMKQKYARIFNKPVDVVALGLHDYYDIIKKPMDLGTVKTYLTKGLYLTPFDFTADVRLTFENAMRYKNEIPTNEIQKDHKKLLNIPSSFEVKNLMKI